MSGVSICTFVPVNKAVVVHCARMEVVQGSRYREVQLDHVVAEIAREERVVPPRGLPKSSVAMSAACARADWERR